MVITKINLILNTIDFSNYYWSDSFSDDVDAVTALALSPDNDILAAYAIDTSSTWTHLGKNKGFIFTIYA